ncbi:unnamed protein product [Tenebrio molitor]|nr:unnamed protein product [Tenebrio molitor]
MNSLKFLLFRTGLSRLQTCLWRHHHSTDSFLTGSSSAYIEDMYNAWLRDPKSVHISWDSYFRHTTQGSSGAYHPPPNLAPLDDVLATSFAAKQVPSSFFPDTPPSTARVFDDKVIEDHLAVQAVIRSYQARGHLVAKVDPLGIMHTDKSWLAADRTGSPPSDIIKNYKLEDMDKVYKLPHSTFIGGAENKLSLREIMRRLEQAYCQHIGVEYMYIDNLTERNFIRQRLEPPGVLNRTPEQKKRTMKRLIRTFEFENFLARKWASDKRFGIEGCEVFIAALKQIIDKASELGVDHFFIGMSHRGRLNVLTNVCRKPLYQLFSQFVPLEPADLGSGDVKYHFGSHTERTNRVTQKHIKLTLLANPSHLECVNAVVLGRTRAEQFYKGDTEGKKSMAIMIHGDAAFCGQGINYENLGLSNLPCYTTHGSICIIINNQIGFTTDPRFSRSSRYCSDLGRVVNAPIFHVNADDPESVMHVCNIAAEWRATFRKDVVIDLVGYRRYGHNESDEPMFTQPMMYTKIKRLTPVHKKYAQQLVQEKVVAADDVKVVQTKYTKILEEEYHKSTQQTQVHFTDWLDSPWSGFFEGKDKFKVAPTGVPEETLVHIGTKFSTPPPANLDFVLHKGLQRMLGHRLAMVKKRTLDWSIAEALAFGSLVKEGIHVRLSGEDVERGTFSHRHHVLHHQTVDKVVYEPLSHLYPDQARYTVCNSSLSEYGVLGFEIGYAQANPHALVMWEAQFGDFFNVAQCLFDQFLAPGQSKWVRQNGLVVLLPHGFDGMGPEHSCAHPERFLMACDDDPHVIPPLGPDFAIKQLYDCNWIVANCSTPANFFHIMRRQVAMAFRKPMILFTPKHLLRFAACKSSFDDLHVGTEFKRAIPEQGEASQNAQNVKKLIFCTGQVYYFIVEVRHAHKLEKEIAVSRIEQMSPFPYDLVAAELDKYPNAKVVWAQEEPKNMGPYFYIAPRLDTLLKKTRDVHYEGRAPSASPATGNKAQHRKEVEAMHKDFMSL